MSEFLIRFRVQPRIHVWVQLLEALRVGVRLHRWLLPHVKLRIVRVFGSLLGHLIDLHLPWVALLRRRLIESHKASILFNQNWLVVGCVKWSSLVLDALQRPLRELLDPQLPDLGPRRCHAVIDLTAIFTFQHSIDLRSVHRSLLIQRCVDVAGFHYDALKETVTIRINILQVDASVHIKRWGAVIDVLVSASTRDVYLTLLILGSLLEEIGDLFLFLLYIMLWMIRSNAGGRLMYQVFIRYLTCALFFHHGHL